MKKLLLSLILTAAGLTAHAADYTYFVIRHQDGTATILSASRLHITFSDGNLIASSSTVSATLALSDLSAMYFSNDGTTGIEGVTTDTDSGDATAYDTAGRFVARAASLTALKQTLRPGLYVIRTKTETLKTLIR